MSSPAVNPADERASTEAANPASAELDRLPIEGALELFDADEGAVLRALVDARPAIARAVELVAGRLARGGRLIYVGAGTSGRLGVLDAAECPPTFRSDPRAVQAVIAGGESALVRAVEGAEDDAEAGAAAIDGRRVGAADVVLGISASGRAPFVRAALARARERGAATVMLACVPFEEAPDEADVSIRAPTGPELVAGSTRLKAGTLTKLVLNRISTLAMVRLGKVHGNRMVDVDARANRKLWRRGVGLVAELARVDDGAAEAALDAARGEVKVAIAALRLGLAPDAARARLDAAGGRLADVLDAGS